MTSILSDYKDNLQTKSHISSFLTRFNVLDALKASDIKKIKGYPMALLLQFIADALSFAKAFILLLNLFANLMKERLFLTDETINNLFHDFMGAIPNSLKNCLPLNAT